MQAPAGGASLEKQTFWNSLITYFGAAIGVLNLLVLYPRILQEHELGLIRLLITQATFFVTLANIGSVVSVQKYLPLWRTADNRHQGLLGYTSFITAFGLLLMTLLALMLRPVIARLYAHEPLLETYYPAFIALGVVYTFFAFLESLLLAQLKTVFSNLLREVFLRLVNTVAVVGLALGWWFFQGTVAALVVGAGLLSAVLFVDVLRVGGFRWSFPRSGWKRIAELTRYGAYVSLTVAALVAAQLMDSLMLAYFASLTLVGVYTTYFYFGTMLMVPGKALHRVLRPAFANAWAAEDWPTVERLYRKSTLVQPLFSLGLLLVVDLNRHLLWAVLGKASFQAYYPVLGLLGAAVTVEMLGGGAVLILSISRHYRWELWLNLLMMLLAFLLNWLMIPLYGGIGAAAATLLTFLAINLLRYLLLRKWYRLHPYSWSHLQLLGSLLGVWSLLRMGQNLAPTPQFIWLEWQGLLAGLLQSAGWSLLFVGLAGWLIYRFQVSPDLNRGLAGLWNKLRVRLGR